MISQRLRGLDQDGEAIDGLVPKLQTLFSSVGINIEDQNGELRSTFDILQDLAGVWDQLSSKQKQYFGEKVAGNRQVKTLNAIMQNWDVVADTIDKANNAQGEALKGNEMYMDSIQGRMTQLKSAFQELAKTTISSDLVKGIVSAGTEITKLTTKVGGLTPVLTGVLGVVMALRGAKIVAGLNAIRLAIAGIASGATLMAGLPGILLAVASAFVMITNSANEANSSLKQFEKAKETYEGHKTKVENLNGELKVTEERINELEGKDSLTIIEKEELQRLKDTNDGLKTQIELEEKLAAISQSEARRKATEHIGLELNKSTNGDGGSWKEKIDGVLGTDFSGSKVTIPDNILDILGRSRINEILGNVIGESVTVFEPTKIDEIQLRVAALSKQYEGLKIILDQINSMDKDADPELYSSLVGDKNKLKKDIQENRDALLEYHNWLKTQTDGLSYVENAEPGSVDEKFNSYIDLMNLIGNTLAYSGEKLEKSEQEIFDSILSKYSSTIDELKEKTKELGGDWQLGVSDSIKKEMEKTQKDLTTQAQSIITVFDQYDDKDIHNTLGDILKKLLDTGNIKDIKRPIIDAAEMYKAGWKEFRESIGSDSISTYYSSTYSGMVEDIPFAISVTPIGADGNVLSPDEVDDYVYKQIDNATNLEELMENDKLENGGKGLFIHLTPAIDISLDAAEQAEAKFGELLHSIDGAFEQAFVQNANGEKVTVSNYLKSILTTALEDPSYTGQALTEIYTIANTLAKNGYTELTDALSSVNIPEAIRQGIGIENMNVEELGIENLESLVKELMTRLGFTVEEAEQALKEQLSDSNAIDIGAQMSISVEETVKGLFQATDGYTKVLTKALSEQEKAGSLTATTIQKLLSSDSGLPGISTCLEKTANGYKLNTDRVNEYVNAQNADIRLNAIAGIMERQLAIDELTAKYGDLETAILSEQDALNLSTWQNEITELQTVADEAVNATNALDALNAAAKTPNEDANYNSAKKTLEAMKKDWEAGKVGTDDFKAGMDYLLGDDWYTRYEGDLEKAYKKAKNRMKNLFAEDDADSVENFMKALSEKKLAEYDPKTGSIKLLTDDLTEVASKLGISETAAKNLFELLNTYSFDNKFEFGDDALDSAEKIAAAQKKLDELEAQKAAKKKELENAQKALNDATNEADEKKKAAEVEALTTELAELETQYDSLATAIDTANAALSEETKTPQTLEEALKSLQEYQQAITVLNENGITTPVELTGKYEEVKSLLSNPTSALTVSATPGEIDPKIEELEALMKAINENPTISATVKATVEGITKATIEGLRKFNGEVKEIEGRKYVQSEITIRPNGIQHATIVIQKLKKEATDLDKCDPTIGIKAEKDKSVDEVKKEVTTLPSPEELTAMYLGKKGKSVDETKEELVDLPSPEELTAMYLAGADSESLSQAQSDIEAVADKEYTATIKATVDTSGGEPVAPTNLTEDQWREYQERLGDPTAIPMILTDDPIVLPPVDREALAEDINSAVEEATSSDDSDFITFDVAPDEDFWNEKLGELTDNPLEVDLKTEQTPEEDAQNYKDLWDAFFEGLGLEVPVEASVDEEEVAEEVEEAIESVPQQEINAGVNEAQITGQVENAVESANPSDVTVNVQQKVQGKVERPKDTTQTVTIKGKDAGGTQTVKNIKNEAKEGAVVPIDADPTEAEKKDDSLIERIKTKVIKLLGLDTGLIYKEADEVDKRLAQKVQKTVEITYRETNQRPYAKGTKKAEEGVSLVDEEGAELIEHTRQGTFELGTNSGARFTHLDKGDVVHTAEETRKILSRVANFGGFFRNGLNRVKSIIGDAFSSGSRVTQTGPITVKPRKKKEEDDSRSGNNDSRSGNNNNDNNNNNNNNNNSDTSAWTNWTKQFFDWVEVKLKRLQAATKSLTDQIDEAVGAAAKNAQIKKVLESIEEQIEANEEAYKEYMEMADKIGEHLSADIINKIKNGTIDISQYDDLTRQKIRDYQKWYDKALACGDAITDLKKKEAELAKQTLKNIADEYDASIRLMNARKGVASSERELEVAKGHAAKGPEIIEEEGLAAEYDPETGEWRNRGDGTKRHTFGPGYGDYQEEINVAEAQEAEARREAESLQAKLDELVQSGEVVQGDATWNEYMEKIRNAIKEANQAAIEAERLKDEAYKAAMAPLGYELDEKNYEESKKTQEMELGNARGSLGDKGKKEAYQSLIEGNESQNETLKTQNELYRQLQQGLDKDSAEYQELEKKIRDNEAAMLANEQQTVQWQKALQNLDLAKFGRQLDALTEKSERLSHSLSVKMAKGIEVTERSYQGLIDTARESIKTMKEENAYYKKLQRKLVRKYGEDAYTSDEYLALQEKINNNNVSIREQESSILQWESDMENLAAKRIGWKIDDLKAKAQELADIISLKQAKGIAVTEDDYRDQIRVLRRERKQIEAQNEEYRRQQEGMDVNSDAYQDLQRKIDAGEAAIRGLDASIVQLQDDMKNIPVKEMGYKLDGLKHEADMANADIDIKKESGKFVSEDDYKAQIDNAEAQKAVLEAQNEEYRKQQKGLDVNSDKYQELQKKIDANEKAMKDLDKATIKWGKDIKKIKIDEINYQLDNLKHAGDMLGKQINLKNINGQYVSESDYRNQINNNSQQRATTEALIAQLERNRAGMDVNSDEYREAQKEINSLTAALLDLDISTAQLEKSIRDLPITNLGYDLNRANAIEQAKNDAIDYKKLTGKELFEGDYYSLWGTYQSQQSILRAQIAQARANQAGMDYYSPEYQSYQQQIDAAEQQLRNIDKKIVETRKQIANLAIEKLGWQLDALDAEADKISNMMELNETQGYDQEASSYQALIENGSKRIDMLEQENRLLQEQLIGLDEMSEEYQRIQAQIKANNDEIAGIKVSQEEWNDSIIDIGIGNIKKYKDALSKSNDQLKRQKELQEAILEVEKAKGSQRKIRTYVEGKGFVYQHDEDEIRKAQESLEDVVRNQLLDKLDDLIDALEDVKRNSNVYDKNGNLIGTTYSTPQLGSLSDILSNYYRNNSNVTLDIGTLKETLGEGIISSDVNRTSFNIGDIIVNEVRNGDDLAKAIVNQFPNALLQALYGK